MAHNYTCKRFIKRKMEFHEQNFLMDKTRGFWKSDKNSKTWQANILSPFYALTDYVSGEAILLPLKSYWKIYINNISDLGFKMGTSLK